MIIEIPYPHTHTFYQERYFACTIPTFRYENGKIIKDGYMLDFGASFGGVIEVSIDELKTMLNLPYVNCARQLYVTIEVPEDIDAETMLRITELNDVIIKNNEMMKDLKMRNDNLAIENANLTDANMRLKQAYDDTIKRHQETLTKILSYLNSLR